jgi:hypothetical protein
LQAMCRSRWSRALGRGAYGGCVVGQDGQGLLRTLHRQVRSLPVRTHPSTCDTATASTARRRDTLECTCCSEGGSALRVRVRELLQVSTSRRRASARPQQAESVSPVDKDAVLHCGGTRVVECLAAGRTTSTRRWDGAMSSNSRPPYCPRRSLTVRDAPSTPPSPRGRIEPPHGELPPAQRCRSQAHGRYVADVTLRAAGLGVGRWGEGQEGDQCAQCAGWQAAHAAQARAGGLFAFHVCAHPCTHLHSTIRSAARRQPTPSTPVSLSLSLSRARAVSHTRSVCTADANRCAPTCREADAASQGRGDGKADAAMQRKLHALRLDVGEAALRDSTHTAPGGLGAADTADELHDEVEHMMVRVRESIGPCGSWWNPEATPCSGTPSGACDHPNTAVRVTRNSCSLIIHTALLASYLTGHHSPGAGQVHQGGAGARGGAGEGVCAREHRDARQACRAGRCSPRRGTRATGRGRADQGAEPGPHTATPSSV